MGKAIPPELLRQIQEDKRKEIEEDSYNKFSNSNCEEEEQTNTQNMVPPIYQNHVQISKIPVHPRPPPNKFSPQYASYIGAKPRAQASARVGLGGVIKN
jgi:alpha-amylase/alpha-mannosidase (GH57 family)